LPERTFDRWEERVGESELVHENSVTHDALKVSFENEETRQALLAELEEIKQETE